MRITHTKWASLILSKISLSLWPPKLIIKMSPKLANLKNDICRQAYALLYQTD